MRGIAERSSVQYLLQALSLSEICVLLCQLLLRTGHGNTIAKFVVDWSGPVELYITPGFACGFAMAVGGALLRLQCYRALGSNFTFNLTIRKDHALATTGPYAIVRHPGYAAVLLYGWSYYFCHFGKGSWWQECGISDTTFGRVIGVVLLLFNLAVSLSAVKRCKLEDEVLKQEFGKQWEKWAHKTPYIMIPYVY